MWLFHLAAAFVPGSAQRSPQHICVNTAYPPPVAAHSQCIMTETFTLTEQQYFCCLNNELIQIEITMLNASSIHKLLPNIFNSVPQQPCFQAIQ